MQTQTPGAAHTHPPSPPAAALPPLPHLTALRCSLLSMVACDGPDLSARQLAVLLTLAVQPVPHTVRGLATALNVSKPAITRAVDRLTDLGLARRAPDPKDRRSVHIRMQQKGAQFLQTLRPLNIGMAA